MNLKNKTNIILIGFMGSGKSAVSKYLAKISQKKCVDTDAMIVESSGKTIKELFDISEDYFRSWERNICSSLKNKHDLIIATGGGIILNKQNRLLLNETGFVVYLKASVDCIYTRTKNSTHRPLLNVPNKKEVISTNLDQRDSLYNTTSDFTIDVDNLTISQIVDKIKLAYENSTT